MGIEFFLTLGLIALIGAIFWIILKHSSEKIVAQYQTLSEKLGLKLDQPAPRMGGFVRPEPSLYGHNCGREMSISALGKGFKNTRQIETVLKLGITNQKIQAQLTAAGPLGGLRQRDSGKQMRWASGDEAFDQAVDVRSNHGEALHALLGKEHRTWLIHHLKKSKATIYIGSGSLAYAKLGLIGNKSIRENFEQAARFLSELAHLIEKKL